MKYEITNKHTVYYNLTFTTTGPQKKYGVLVCYQTDISRLLTGLNVPQEKNCIETCREQGFYMYFIHTDDKVIKYTVIPNLLVGSFYRKLHNWVKII